MEWTLHRGMYFFYLQLKFYLLFDGSRVLSAEYLSITMISRALHYRFNRKLLFSP